MGALPEELWVQILQTGLGNTQLQYRDLCALAIVCRRLRRISELDCLWKALVTRDFPSPETSASVLPLTSAAADSSLRKPSGSEDAEGASKKLYKTRYEKVKEKRIAAHKRQVLRVTSTLNVLQRKNQALQRLLQLERDKLLSTQKELENLERTSRSAVALQIWQPSAVTTRHEQVVQQSPIDVAARKNSLWMEIQVTKSCICCNETTLKLNKKAIETRKKELDALTYNPTLDLTSNKEESGKRVGKKRKRDDLVSELDSLIPRRSGCAFGLCYPL